MALNRLGERDGSALVEQLAGNAGVSAELVAEIAERSDGVPLFIEELTKAVVEAGADRGASTVSGAPAAALAVPATLHASLLGRLDRLGPKASWSPKNYFRSYFWEDVAPGAMRDGVRWEDLTRLTYDAGSSTWSLPRMSSSTCSNPRRRFAKFIAC